MLSSDWIKGLKELKEKGVKGFPLTYLLNEYEKEVLSSHGFKTRDFSDVNMDFTVIEL